MKWWAWFIVALVGVGILVVTALSWIMDPGWSNTPGGLLAAFAAAAVGVLGVVGGSLSMLKTLKELGEEKKPPMVNVTVNVPPPPTSPTPGQKPEEKAAMIELPPPDELPEPGGLPKGSRMTFERNEVFTGREDDLLAIANALVYVEGSGLGIVQAAGGMGGIGKTELAVEFCYRYGRFFEGVHWIQARAETREEAGEAEIAAEIAACGARMGLEPWPRGTPEQVERTLREWRRGGRRLAVLDNLEDPELLGKWRPRLGGVRVLVTSRRTDWPRGMGVETYRLGLLKREESLELLRKLAARLREVSDEELGEIGERLGDLPLALELCGRYLYDRPGLGVEGFLKELEEKGVAVDPFFWTLYKGLTGGARPLPSGT
jgi:hypothetical protein